MIKSKLIILDSSLSSRESVVQHMIEKAYDEELLSDKRSFYESVKERELLASTAVGYGIAIPHGKDDSVREPFVAFMRTKRSFDWDVNIEEKVNSIFLMGLPKEDGDKLHLKFLAEISKKLMNDSFREALLECETEEEAYILLNEVNEKIGGEQ